MVGAGPAGLATSRELARGGIGTRARARRSAWLHAGHNLYDSLVLHTAKHLSALPGTAVSARPRRSFRRVATSSTTWSGTPTRSSCRSKRPSDVTAVERAADRWVVCARAAGATLESRTLVIATGIVANPWIPDDPRTRSVRGRVMHSVDYRRPDGFSGQRVLVVGAGNSAGEISVELARAWRASDAWPSSPARMSSRASCSAFRFSTYRSSSIRCPEPSSSDVTTAIGALRGPRVSAAAGARPHASRCR